MLVQRTYRSLFSLVLVIVCTSLAAEEGKTKNETSNLATKLQAVAKQAANQQTYELRYQLAPNEIVRWQATHLVTIDTKISGTEHVAKTRSVSTKAWKVQSVDKDGNMTFVNLVEAVDMWQSATGSDEISYNSQTDTMPPKEYEVVAKTVGQPLSTITINRFGRMLKRENAQPQFSSPGMGDITIPLPEQAIKAGTSWHVPDEVQCRLEDGRTVRVQTRQRYTLDKVEAAVATIAMKTEIVTPVNDPKVQSQLVQRLTQGTIKFDMDAGRVLSKQLDLDETVIGFTSQDSIMQYRARFSEELLPANAAELTAKKP